MQGVKRIFSRKKKAGITRCSLHDLRRTFASHAAVAGVNEAVVQEALGHASINTTLQYYTNIPPEAVRAAQNRLPYLDAAEKIVPEAYFEGG